MPQISHKKRKKLTRYLHALSSFLNCNSAIEAVRANSKSEDLEHLYVALFVSYARPFTENRGLGSLPEDFLLDEELIDHDSIMRVRNQVFGHSDVLAESDNGIKMTRMLIEKEGDAVSFKPISLSCPTETLNGISEHVNRLIARCRSTLRNIYKEIDFSDIPDGTHAINITSENDNLIK